MNHEEFRAAYLAGEIDNAAEAHLKGCAVCRAVVDDLTVRRRHLAAPETWEEPDPSLENLVVAAIADGPASVSRIRPVWWVLPAAAVIAAVFLLTRPPAPDWEVEMPGVDAAAGATATVSGWNAEGGTRMMLSVSGLDPAPDGFVYEFWLSDGPVHISAGTFTVADGVELWAGVARRDYPRLWVTVEPLDADATPSRAVVLDTR